MKLATGSSSKARTSNSVSAGPSAAVTGRTFGVSGRAFTLRWYLRDHAQPPGRTSPSDKSYGEMLVAPDHKAVGPPGRVFGVKGDAASAFEQHAEDDARFDSGEGCSNAMVDAAPERHVASWNWSLEVDLVGSFEHGGVAVGRA